MMYARQQRSPTRQFGGIAVVIALHIFLGWALVTGSARQAVQLLKQPLVAKIIEEAKPPEQPPPPPPPPPKFNTPPPPFIPPVEIQVATPPPVSAVATTSAKPTTAALPPTTVAPQQTAKAEPVSIPAVVTNVQNCKPEYPSISKRLEETGTVQLRFLIGANGQVLKAEVAQSSGKKRLDEAALSALQQCSFKPGSIDGKPVESWAPVNYKFVLD